MIISENAQADDLMQRRNVLFVVCFCVLKVQMLKVFVAKRPVKVGVKGFSAFRVPILAQSLDSIGENATTQVTQWML